VQGVRTYNLLNKQERMKKKKKGHNKKSRESHYEPSHRIAREPLKPDEMREKFNI
jgi:hypothetical protein